MADLRGFGSPPFYLYWKDLTCCVFFVQTRDTVTYWFRYWNRWASGVFIITLLCTKFLKERELSCCVHLIKLRMNSLNICLLTVLGIKSVMSTLLRMYKSKKNTTIVFFFLYYSLILYQGAFFSKCMSARHILKLYW